jgi:hypothetical protein
MAHETPDPVADSHGVHRRRHVPPLVVVVLVALALASAADARRQTPDAPRRPLTLSLAGQWQTWWGNVGFDAKAVTLSSAVPTSPAETHSALVTSKRRWRDQTLSFTTTTLAQLRARTTPNVWEVGWAMLRFRDLENYYYFIVKPNGFELGKKHGSDAQIFLATGDLPRLSVGRAHKVRLQAQGARIRASVDGVEVLDFTDPNPLLSPGSVGLYEEDSHVRFDSLAAS